MRKVRFLALVIALTMLFTLAAPALALGEGDETGPVVGGETEGSGAENVNVEDGNGDEDLVDEETVLTKNAGELENADPDGEPEGGNPRSAYTINFINDAGHGTITSDQGTSVAAGTYVTLIWTPDPDYGLQTLTVLDGNSNSLIPSGWDFHLNSSFGFTMPASDVTVTTVFGQLYPVEIGTYANGSLTAYIVPNVEGATITLTPDPDIGYELKSVTVVATEGGASVPVTHEGGFWHFVMPAGGATISAANFGLIDGVASAGGGHMSVIPWHGYDTLAEAFANSPSTSIVVLNEDTAENITVQGGDYELRLCGHTVTGKITVWNGASLTIVGSGTITNDGADTIDNRGTLIIDGATVTNTTANDTSVYSIKNTAGTTTVDGGAVTRTDGGDQVESFAIGALGGTVQVNGGTVTGSSTGVHIDGGALQVASGLTVTSDGEGGVTVHSVTFWHQVDGGWHVKTTVQVPDNTTLTQEQILQAQDALGEGGHWCTDESLQTAFNFSTPITQNTNLYASVSSSGGASGGIGPVVIENAVALIEYEGDFGTYFSSFAAAVAAIADCPDYYCIEIMDGDWVYQMTAQTPVLRVFEESGTSLTLIAPEGYDLVTETGDEYNTYTLDPQGVAAVYDGTNTTVYPSLEAAIAAAQDGDTVILYEDRAENATITDKAITLDLGGNTLTGWITVESTSSLNLRNGTVTYTGSDTIVNNGTLNLNGATVENNTQSGGSGVEGIYAVRNVSGTTIVNGGVVTRTDAGDAVQSFAIGALGGIVHYNNGTITGTDTGSPNTDDKGVWIEVQDAFEIPENKQGNVYWLPLDRVKINPTVIVPPAGQEGNTPEEMTAIIEDGYFQQHSDESLTVTGQAGEITFNTNAVIEILTEGIDGHDLILQVDLTQQPTVTNSNTTIYSIQLLLDGTPIFTDEVPGAFATVKLPVNTAKYPEGSLVKVEHRSSNGQLIETLYDFVTNGAITVDLCHFSTVEISKEDVPEKFTASLNLQDEILMNFNLKQLDPTAAYRVEYSFNGAAVASEDVPANSTQYSVVVARCAAKQLKDTVAISVYRNDVLIKNIPAYSVYAYCQSKLASNAETAEMKDLARALLNYGGYAQINFNYKTNDLANEGLNLPLDSVPYSAFEGYGSSGSCASLKRTTTSLELEYRISLNFYFKPVDGYNVDNLVVTVNDNGIDYQTTGSITVTKTSEGWLQLRIADICAKDLDNRYTVTVSDGSTQRTFTDYSPLVYLYQQSSTDIAKAAYAYYIAAEAYFDSVQPVQP